MCNIMSQRLKFSFYQKYRYGTVFFDGQILPLSNKNGRSFPPWSIRYFHLFQNAPCMPPPPPPSQKLHKHCFPFLFWGREGSILPWSPGGGSSHMKGKGMLVVSLRGVNFRFWSNLRCSGQNTIIFSRKGLF